MERRGIDVSVHQGVIDWEKVKGNIDFAIIRCGYGIDKEAYDDKQFVRNVKECERLGIPFGVYLYSYATNVEEAKSEAAHTLRLIRGLKLEYPVFYDVEDPQYQSHLSNDTLATICHTYCSLMEEAGYYVGIYSSLHWFRTKLNLPILNRYDKWVAQWNQKDQAPFAHGMWQYTSDGRVTGISGRVDMNIAYYDYPEIMKRQGLNGFTKPTPTPEPEPTPKPEPDVNTCEETVKKLKEENEVLKKELEAIKQVPVGEIQLIFTSPKQATYYIVLEEGDRLYYQSAIDNKEAS